jgi:hypothetical protein
MSLCCSKQKVARGEASGSDCSAAPFWMIFTVPLSPPSGSINIRLRVPVFVVPAQKRNNPHPILFLGSRKNCGP